MTLADGLDPASVVTSPESWFRPYAERLCAQLEARGLRAVLCHEHEAVPQDCRTAFLLSYFRIVDTAFLEARKHTLVVHASDLPEGRGWAPLFWQIIAGRSRIPVVLFEAGAGVDEGDIYLKDHMQFEGHELNPELRRRTGEMMIDLSLRFVDEYATLSPQPQRGTPSSYPRRTPADSELDPDRTLREQFDLLRTVHNEEYPAFFRMAGRRYVLRIHADPADEAGS